MNFQVILLSLHYELLGAIILVGVKSHKGTPKNFDRINKIIRIKIF